MSSENFTLDEFKLTIFAHDSYIMYLPNLELFSYPSQKFFQESLGYQNFKDIRQRKLKIAPIIRVYGTNMYGQKCCLHVHGYFPYFYVKVEDLSSVLTEKFLKDFAELLERAYNLAFCNSGVRKNPTFSKYNNEDATAFPEVKTAFKQFLVHSIEVIEKFDFYGYHSKKEKFFKVKVYDPKYVKPLCKLLTSGTFMDRKFQTYESHISYYMHFYSDCNIYGMNEVKVMNYKFRKNYEEKRMRAMQKIFVEKQFVNSLDLYLHPFDLVELERTNPECFSSLQKTSTCYVELDVNYESILNKIEYDLMNSGFFTQRTPDKGFTANLSQEVFEVKITKALSQLWNDEQQRRNALNIKEPLTFYVNYMNNIECHMSQIKTDLKGLEDFNENLSNNCVWDESYRVKFEAHINEFFESLKRMQESQEPIPKTVFYNENQLLNFVNVLLSEKVIE